MRTFPFDQEVVWRPDPQEMAASRLAAFMAKNGILTYRQLLNKAKDDVAWFWDAVIRDLEIQFYVPYRHVYEDTGDPAFPAWCVGGEMNIVHNLLDKWQESPELRNRVAIRYEQEEGGRDSLSYGELHAEVCRCAMALRARGFGKGDAIGLFMPMTPQMVVAFLAIIKIGGIVLPLFSGYGPEALITRLRDAHAKALFTCNAFYRRGKVVPMKSVVDEALPQLPDLSLVIVHERVPNFETKWNGKWDVTWDDFLDGQPYFTVTERTRAEDVLMVIYTSGTTGKPKGAVHTHCGFPIKAAQDMAHCMDVKPGDSVYWMTDMGWMMGPWMVFGTLLLGASMVLYDGAPDYPDVDRTWGVADRSHTTHLGVSPVLIRSLKAHGPEPIQRYKLNALRIMASTGSPWDPDSWMWAFKHVLKGLRPILNYSGGTEISGGIVCGNVFSALKPCAFSGPVPGMDADVVGPDGQPVRGEVGELIIRKPWIGMTRGFWRDPQRYRETYWQERPGVWTHGDYAAIDDDGLWYILGRSDDTLKIAGKRLGPAEVEAIVNAHPDVLESAAIAAPHPVKSEIIVVFAVLRAGVSPSDTLRTQILQACEKGLGKALAPSEVRFTTALPKTRNAKVLRRLIRAVYLRTEPGDLSALEDPLTLHAIREAV